MKIMGGTGVSPVLRPPRWGGRPRPGRPYQASLRGIFYIFFRVDFRHELPARGLLFRTRQCLALLCLGVLCLVLTDRNLWFSEAPSLPPPWFWLTRPPYSTIWAAAGAPGARARPTTITTITSSLFTKTVLKNKFRRGSPPLQKMKNAAAGRASTPPQDHLPIKKPRPLPGKP
jgi:hypothetical protein